MDLDSYIFGRDKLTVTINSYDVITLKYKKQQ